MTDKTVSVYWFFLLFIIAFAIVFVVHELYGKPLDIRSAEAVFLGERIADCISRGGMITSEGKSLLEGGTEANLLSICRLNFNVEKYKEVWNNDQLFASVEFEGGAPIPAGNLRLNSPENNINFFGANRQFPFCSDRTIYSKNGEKIILIRIIACVRKTEKNV